MVRRAIRHRLLGASLGGAIALAPSATAAATPGSSPAPTASAAPVGAPPAIPPPPGTPPPPGPAPSAGLRLEQAVELALSRNERAKISDLNVTVADAAVERARAGFLPVLTFGANDTQTAVLAAGQPGNVGSGNLVLTQPILNASAFPLYAQAKALARAQRAQNTDDKRLLAFNAATAFFAVLSEGALADAAQRQFDNAQANLADAQARADAQLTSSNDVTRAKVDVASAGRELAADQGQLANAYAQLSFIINAPLSGGPERPDAMLAIARQPLVQPETLVKFAFAHRPDLQASIDSANAAHHFADEPMMRLIPTVGLTGAVSGTTNAPASTRVWNEETLAATLGWTIFDAGSRYADKHSREAQAMIADLNLQQLGRNIEAQVNSAIALLVAAQAEFLSATQARDSAQLNVDETAILYRQGLAKAIELVDANDSRFSAEVNYASAEYSTAVAYLNLRQALGLDALGTEIQ